MIVVTDQTGRYSFIKHIRLVTMDCTMYECTLLFVFLQYLFGPEEQNALTLLLV